MPERMTYLAAALGEGDPRCAAVLFVTHHMNHVPRTTSRTESLKMDILSTINTTGHLINMEPQAGFGFSGPKTQVGWE